MLRIAVRFALLWGASSPLVADAQEPKTAGIMPPLGAAMGPAVDPRAASPLGRVKAHPAFDDIVTPVLTEPVVPQNRPWARWPTYRGSNYRVSPGSAAAELPQAMLDMIETGLTVADFVPFDRLEYFNWCFEPDKAVVGWSGHVEDFRITPIGWVIVVRVSPKLERATSVGTMTGDYLLEGYYFGGGALFEYLGCVPGPHALRKSIFGF